MPGPRSPRLVERTPALRAALLITATVLLSGCSDPLTPDPGPGPEDFEVEIGSGVISPWRILPWPAHDDLLVLTGRGETFGGSFLHRVRPTDLADQGQPLELCPNASDMVWESGAIFVTCRGSSELLRVDPEAWAVTDREGLVFQPIAVSADGAGRVFVTGAASLLSEFSAAGGLAPIRTVSMASPVFCSVPVGDELFAAMPSRGVARLDRDSWLESELWIVPGETSFGCTLWNDDVWVSDRDGYLHRIDPSTSALESYDVVTWLGLDRDSVGIRGVDPYDVLPIDSLHLLVTNNRAASVVLAYGGADEPPTVVSTAPRGAAAMLDSARDQALITLPFFNVVHRAAVAPAASAASWAWDSVTVGVGVTDAVLVRALTGEERLAVLDTEGSLLFVDTDGSIRGPTNATSRWERPLVATHRGSLLALEALSEGDDLVELDWDGSPLQAIEVSLDRPVYSGHSTGDSAILVDRLGAHLELIDLRTRTSSLVPVERTRPSAAVYTDFGWIATHDTWPDFGVSWGGGAGVAGDRQLPSSMFDVVRLDGDQVVAVSFPGDLYRLSGLGESLQSTSLPFSSVERLTPVFDSAFLAISPDQGVVARIGTRTLEVMEEVFEEDLRLAFLSQWGYWLVGSRVVSFQAR